MPVCRAYTDYLILLAAKFYATGIDDFGILMHCD